MANGKISKSFFGKAEPKFCMPPDDGKIEAVPFLQAAKHMPLFAELLGTAFRPIKSDIQGNITKLENVLEKHSDQDFKTFHDMLEYEQTHQINKHDKSATISLLWLKRAFTYIVLLLENIVEDHRNGKKQENIVTHCAKAYEASLKMYHKWIIQKIFSVMMRACPYRRDFFKAMASGSEMSDDDIVKELEEFLSVMRPNIDALCLMFTTLDVDYQDKV